MVCYLIPRELSLGRYESERLSSFVCVNCSNYEFFFYTYNINYIVPILLYMATMTTYTYI